MVDVLESVVSDTETFFYPSGINVEYMPTAPFEQRITKVSNPDGTSFDLDKTYKVAIMGESISPQNYSEIIVGDDSVDNVVTDAITKAKTIRPANDGQFVIVD